MKNLDFTKLWLSENQSFYQLAANALTASLSAALIGFRSVPVCSGASSVRPPPTSPALPRLASSPPMWMRVGKGLKRSHGNTGVGHHRSQRWRGHRSPGPLRSGVPHSDFSALLRGHGRAPPVTVQMGLAMTVVPYSACACVFIWNRSLCFIRPLFQHRVVFTNKPVGAKEALPVQQKFKCWCDV